MNPDVRQIPPHQIGVVASADENYAPHLMVMFVSLLANCPEPGRIALYCIDGGIGEPTKSRMQREIERAGGQPIDFIQFDKSRYDNLPTIKHITSSAYYRISIPDIFTEDVKKVIYLDCDMIVRGNVIDLWSIDIEGYHLGAVENLSGHTYKKLGIPQNEYFNSGMLLINLDLWRRDGIPEKVFQFKIDNPDRISTNDQCALNGVLHQSWKHLPLAWNHQTGLYRPSAQIDAFDRHDVDSAIRDPKIIHYIGWDKPWRKIRFHPLADEYDRYADRLERSPRSQPSLMDAIAAYASISRLKKWWRCARWRRWYSQQGFKLYHDSHKQT
ncbi:MAG: glycosyltransferase family 8 protein [Marinobacter sp.]|nr:glycosyltransferase family 8 protein [Marinobacter sp.]